MIISLLTFYLLSLVLVFLDRLLNLDENLQANSFLNMLLSESLEVPLIFIWLWVTLLIIIIIFKIHNWPFFSVCSQCLLCSRENLFEDGNHLYRFLDNDPIVSSQCHNIPRGIIDVKPKPIIEIASRLRFLSYAILEAYTSEDGKHVDYRSIHGSEEYARFVDAFNFWEKLIVVGISEFLLISLLYVSLGIWE